MTEETLIIVSEVRPFRANRILRRRSIDLGASTTQCLRVPAATCSSRPREDMSIVDDYMSSNPTSHVLEFADPMLNIGALYTSREKL